MNITVTLPWPPKELSPNFRTKSVRWIARIKKEYREKVAEAAWTRGVRPFGDMTLERVTFHPPADRPYDKDNLIARFKAGQDGLADVMGVDDSQFDPDARIGAKVHGGAVVALLTEIPAKRAG